MVHGKPTSPEARRLQSTKSQIFQKSPSQTTCAASRPYPLLRTCSSETSMPAKSGVSAQLQANIPLPDLTAAAPNSIFGTVGVNSIHVLDDILYLTNTGLSLFASIPLHPNGTPSRPGYMISQFSNKTQYADDFAVQGHDAYPVTGSGYSIERIGLDGRRKGSIIVGGLNSTQIAEPTSCAFGWTERDQHVLYVVTAGGLASPIDGDEVVGAQVLAVDTRTWREGWEW